MKKIIFLLIACSFLPVTINAQLWQARRWEASVGIGPTLFFGDIGGFSRDENVLGFRDMGIKQTRYNIDANLKYRILKDLNARISLDFGILHASDLKGSNISRGFESRTLYFEPMALVEYYFIKNKAESNYLFLAHRGKYISSIFKSLDFYVFSGFGTNIFNVKANEALETKGFEEKGSAFILPLGVGVGFIFSPEINLGAEFCGRYAFSDYLDGYSSQYSKTNDVYYTINLTATYKFRTGPKGGPTLK